MEIKSLYLDRFKKLSSHNTLGTLKGSRLYVEKLPEPERKSKGGIILATDKDHASPLGLGSNVPQFYLVLQVGEGYSDDTGAIIPGSMDAKTGDVVVIPRHSVQLFSMLPALQGYVPDTIGVTREDEIVANFGPVEDYLKYYEILNEGV